MKSLMRNMAFLAVITLYIVSTMGYGVHRCTADGTASLILLFGESPCEYVHSHMDGHGNTYTHSHAPGEHHNCDGEHHHECTHNHGEDEHEGCCTTDVYMVSEDQTTSDDNFDIVPQMTLLANVLQGAVEQQGISYVSAANALSLLLAQHPKEAPQAVLCTFRI